MDLSGVRDLVIEASGRLDLSEATQNFYINQGVRWLDGQQTHLLSDGQRDFQLAIGAVDLVVSEGRSAESVYWKDSDRGLVSLEFIPYAEAIKLYPKAEGSDRGTVVYWTHKPAERGEHTGVLLRVFPPPTMAATLTVLGKYSSGRLTEDGDENFWSVEYPQLLVLASLWCIESANRNREGMRDYEAAMNTFLTGIDKDLADAESAGNLVMQNWISGL